MKPDFKRVKTNILIIPANLDAVVRALGEANGTTYPHAHSYSCFSDLQEITEKAEARALKLLGSVTAIKGVRVISKSGRKVCNAYKFGRRATTIEIVRRADGWHLVAAEGCWVPTCGGYTLMRLTPEHEKKAVALLRRQFNYHVVDKDQMQPAVAKVNTTTAVSALKLVPITMTAAA